MLHPAVEEAYAVVHQGTPITRQLAEDLATLSGAAVMDLVSLANKVRQRFADSLHLCSIVNAKSGLCGENCRFCAQSVHYATGVPRYPLLDREEILARARAAYEQGVRHFGIVTSGGGYARVNAEFEAVCAAIMHIHQELPDLQVCASLGVLGAEAARRLAQCEIAYYNINLQVAPGRYAELVADSHGCEDRIETIRRLRGQGIRVCSGALLGLGETMADRLELAFTLQDLDVDMIPLNVLIPIPGTPVEHLVPLPAIEVAQVIALYRLIHPRSTIKVAAGRETVMKDFQGLLMLAGANGFLTGGYLTTRGRDWGEDRVFQEQLALFGP